MNFSILFDNNQIHQVNQNKVQILLLAPGVEIDFNLLYRQFQKLTIIDLNDYIEKGEMSTLSRICAEYVRNIIKNQNIKDNEAVSSQNDLYQYHLRRQYLFLTALCRYFDSCDLTLKFIPTGPLINKYLSPMRPEINILFNQSLTMNFLAARACNLYNYQILHNNLLLNTFCASFKVFLRAKLFSLYSITNCLKKSFSVSKKHPIILLEKCYDLLFVVRTDSEVLSAYSIIKNLPDKNVSYLLVVDELHSSKSTINRVSSLNLPFIKIGDFSKGKSFFKALFSIRKSVFIEPNLNDEIYNIPQKILFSDINIYKCMYNRLFDFFFTQKHFSFEFINILSVINPKNVIAFSFVDQWGGVIKSCADKIGLNTFAIQNAAQDPEEYPRLCWADHYFVESMYLKNRLLELGYPREKITASGLPHYFSNSSISLDESRKHRRITLFTQPIYSSYFESLIQEISIYCRNYNYTFAIKFHPRQSINDYSDVICKAKKICNVEVYTKESSDEILNKTSLTVSVVSSVIVRSLNLGIPTLVYLPKSETYLDLYYTDHNNVFVGETIADIKYVLDIYSNDQEGFAKDFTAKLFNYNLNHNTFEPMQNPIDNILSIVNADN